MGLWIAHVAQSSRFINITFNVVWAFKNSIHNDVAQSSRFINITFNVVWAFKNSIHKRNYIFIAIPYRQLDALYYCLQ